MKNFKEPVNNLELFPNPTENILNLQSNLFNGENAIVSIFDITGKINYQCETQVNNMFQINVFSLPPGVYIVRIIQGKNIFHDKFIKY